MSCVILAHNVVLPQGIGNMHVSLRIMLRRLVSITECQLFGPIQKESMERRKIDWKQ